MGHKDESAEIAGGTVKIGWREVEDIGGVAVTKLALPSTARGAFASLPEEGNRRAGSPEMTGGGRSSSSDAFRVS